MADSFGTEPGSGGSGGGGGGGEPDAHAATHVTGGTDVIASAVASGNAGLMTGVDKAKLDSVTVASIPSSGEKSALVGTSGTPGSGNKYVTDGDARNTNARTPSAHATTHVTGGSDVIADAVASGNSGLMSGADKAKLDGVEAGAQVTSSARVLTALAAAASAVAVNGQKITGLGTPTADGDAATKAYVDSVGGGGGGGDATSIQGFAVDTATPTDGQVFQWVGASSKWVPTTRQALTAGTGITMSSYDGLVARTVAVAYGTSSSTACVGDDARLSDSRAPNGSASGDLGGSYPGPTVAKINGATLGTVTATSGRLLVADGAAWQSVALSGDATLASNGALTLANTAATPGSYGSATQVATFTVDAKGRLTAAGNTTITGVVPAAHASSHLAGGSDPLLAAPGAIGGTTPAAGTFTTLGATQGLTISTGQQLTAGANNLLLTDQLAAAKLLIASQAVGDVLYASSTTAWSRLPVGTDGQVLTLASGVPTWADAAGGGGGLTQAQALKLASFRG